jgi:hypothetical protein
VVKIAWENVILRYRNVKNPNSSFNLKSVTISTDVDTENLTKTINIILPPQSSANWEQGKKTTTLIDLQRIEERVTIDGFLVTDQGTSAAFDVGDGDGSQSYIESRTASDKKTDLKGMFTAGGTVWMTYEGSTFEANMDKLEIRSDNKDGAEPGSGEIGFSIRFTAVKGSDL